MRPHPMLAAVALTGLLAGCTSTTSGTGSAPAAVRSTDVPSSAAATAAPTPAPSSAPASTTAPPSGPPTHPVPAGPLRTATVHAAGGATYVVRIWAEVRTPTCADHAYGTPVVDFLTAHPCLGLDRLLGTTEVGGRPVGFAESTLGFTGTAADPYRYAGRFKALVAKDGTGNLDDLLREGYRLPAGPAEVPAPDAFNVLGQDNGVTVWDVWYLDGPTPQNDPELVQLTVDLFLQF